MWVYASIIESKQPVKIFYYRSTRAVYNPQAVLKGFHGYVITDGYASYNNLENVTSVFCWAHARRKFRNSITKAMKNSSESLRGTALNKIGKLFKIEKEIEDKKTQEKVEIRFKEAKPLLEEF